ncbi:hypothetical protein KNP414_05116 [Paenibacillus mucilaginosus KNP414]|uniref:Uncharacterized protein n=1 Tax=Paenibacillus mucilaginosus (strain KNP414) TaxID=1036673 RepID=F8F9F1_PAEMK|nr:hypothetical protein KNP414_05116 [Paenibacillus mucilaginosus KNP414]
MPSAWRIAHVPLSFCFRLQGFYVQAILNRQYYAADGEGVDMSSLQRKVLGYTAYGMGQSNSKGGNNRTWNCGFTYSSRSSSSMLRLT